jgi:hypothetical protein
MPEYTVFRRKEQRFLCTSGSATVRKNGARVSCPSAPFLSCKGKPRKGTDVSVVEAKARLLTESRVAVEARYKPPVFKRGYLTKSLSSDNKLYPR